MRSAAACVSCQRCLLTLHIQPPPSRELMGLAGQCTAAASASHQRPVKAASRLLLKSRTQAQCRDVVGVCPGPDFIYSLDAYSETPGYSHYAAVYEKYLKGFFVSNLKRQCHASNYDPKVSFSICFYVVIFLPAFHPLETKQVPSR